MADHITFDSMSMDVIYECKSCRPLYASGGYYYIVQITQITTNTNYIMALTDGCIYNKLEKFRMGSVSATKFSFKKTSVDSVNNSTNIIIVIIGDNDTVTLN